MVHAPAFAESIVAPTLFRPEFSHSLGQQRKSGVGLGMSVVGGQAEVDLITRAAGRVSPQEEPATLVR